MRYYINLLDSKLNLLKGSDTGFRPFNVAEIKERFNNDFVKSNPLALEIRFKDISTDVTFIAGFRNKPEGGQKVVIINKTTKREFSAKEFSAELDVIDSIFRN